MLGPNIFSSVNFWLPDDFVFVQLQIVIAVEAFWPELRNGIICVALRAAQHAGLPKHTHTPCACKVDYA